MGDDELCNIGEREREIYTISNEVRSLAFGSSHAHLRLLNLIAMSQQCKLNVFPLTITSKL